MSDRSLSRACLFCLASALLPAGCRPAPGPAGAPELPVIPVSRPVQRSVTDYVEYTGRTAAVNAVDIRPRVTGYLVQAPFTEGAEVKKGELLFEIDPRPYQAMYDSAKAQLSQAEANYRLAQAENRRSRALAARDATSISREELERYQAQEATAFASQGVAQANLNWAQLNLDFTKVTSPIDGIVSRYYYTLGNLVNQDQTLLTTVVSPDPMYAYFDMDERTILRIRTAINEGKIVPHKNTTDIPVLLGLEGEEGYPHAGTVSFINNTVNPQTGTLAVRGVFANPKPENGRRLMSPGMFVRIRLPIGQPHPAVLVVDRAIGSDQGLKFVYVLDEHNTVQYRRVTTGPLEDDGLRVIEEGLKPDEWVVVSGLQQVRPRVQVEPEPVPMPTLGAGAQGQAPGVSGRPQPPPPGENPQQRQGQVTPGDTRR